uniref:WAT1-related protein n=1 Tax=Aegilops tauschii TaxID=37682 RepID=M8CBZ7_AEGTA
MTTEIFVYLFLSALLGASLTQWLFFFGLRYTTATFASAFINMTPMFTFLLALPFKIEKLDVATRSGAGTITGTAVGLAGAILMALYQGPALTGTPTTDHHATAGAHGGGAWRWAIGSAALLGGSASWSLWFILQSKIGTKYPALYSSTAWMFLLSTAQMAAMIAAGINVTVLHEQLHLGSVVGSALVVVGLYLVLWGKSNEASSKPKLPPPSHSKLALDEETEHGDSRIMQSV